jgi:cell division protein YceG involved in septum cleavage
LQHGRPPGPIEQVTIPPGSSFGVVTDSLAAHHVIEHPKWFKLLARAARAGSVGTGRRVPAGPGLIGWSVMDALEAGDQLMLRVTVPEGLTSRRSRRSRTRRWAFRRFVHGRANDAVGASAFVPGAMSFEGLLLPETYLVPAVSRRVPSSVSWRSRDSKPGIRLGAATRQPGHDATASPRARLDHRGRGPGRTVSAR